MIGQVAKANVSMFLCGSKFKSRGYLIESTETKTRIFLPAVNQQYKFFHVVFLFGLIIKMSRYEQ